MRYDIELNGNFGRILSTCGDWREVRWMVRTWKPVAWSAKPKHGPRISRKFDRVISRYARGSRARGDHNACGRGSAA